MLSASLNKTFPSFLSWIVRHFGTTFIFCATTLVYQTREDCAGHGAQMHIYTSSFSWKIRDSYRDYIPVYADGLSPLCKVQYSDLLVHVIDYCHYSSKTRNKCWCSRWFVLQFFPSNTITSKRLPDSATIFTAEIWTIVKVLEHIKYSGTSKYINFYRFNIVSPGFTIYEVGTRLIGMMIRKWDCFVGFLLLLLFVLCCCWGFLGCQ